MARCIAEVAPGVAGIVNPLLIGKCDHLLRDVFSGLSFEADVGVANRIHLIAEIDTPAARKRAQPQSRSLLPGSAAR